MTLAGPTRFLDLVARQARLRPDARAATYGDRSLTYDELWRRAGHLASILRRHGVCANVPVAIAVPRSLELAVAVLGSLRAQGAYVPLDPAYPNARLAMMLEDASPRVLLTTSQLSERWTALGGEPRVTILLDEDLDVAPGEATPDAGAGSPDDLAYLIFTSGSTGRPKAVAMRHAPLDHLIAHQCGESRLEPGARTLQFAPLSFDVSFQEMLSTWAQGGELLLLGDEIRLDAVRLLGFLEEQEVQRVFLPFVALQSLCEIAEGHRIFPGSLREVVTAGEQLQITPAVRAFFLALRGCRLFNHYGPSETHVVTSLPLPEDPATWPPLPSIGRSLPHVRLHIVDESLAPVAPGTPGELLIGGDALAQGYYGRDELTERSFLPDHLGSSGGRLYRTGDLAQLLPDGSVQFLGRIGGQVKIRGYRIELGEVEVALAEHAAVAQCVVDVREDRQREKRLVAYVVRRGEAKPSALELRRHLAARLPDYMVPAAIVELEALPRTPSGKIDRRALPAPGRERPGLSQPFVEPNLGREAQLAALWGELLELDQVGVLDNFFELGGNSLKAIQMLARLKAAFGLHVPVTRFFEEPTIKAIFATGDGSAAEAARPRRPLAPRGFGAEDARDQRIAIIGMALRFPGAQDPRELWETLLAGRETVTFFDEDELDPSIPASVRGAAGYVRARGIIDDWKTFDHGFFGIRRREAELMDPQQRKLLEVSWHALEDAGLVADEYPGPIGVFAGLHNNTYFKELVLGRPDLVDAVGEFQAMLLQEKDYAATRVAHKLDLRGPALSIQTACSTSLVAVHAAILSLRHGDCDVALAGAAAITVPVQSGHLHVEGGMLSADGHTRPFDASAQGTIFSDGVAVVVLKRLADARRDGDRILGVIAGTAVNNDGSAKASFTAPSVRGQAEVIARAQADAGVSPRAISYVEAHGTATPVGDPIEVEALTKAFREGTSDVGFCRLGSIKSNMGHLTAAAGLAGVLKTTLALQRGIVPPSINFTAASDLLDLASSPFVVNDRPTAWPKLPGEPRRAGVSSFGVGGTNAHVVLEEAPDEDARPSLAATWQLLPLSAKTAEALAALRARLAAHLQALPPDQPLADQAWTLQIGRKAFPHRCFVLAETAGAAASRLASLDAGHSGTGDASKPPRGVAFLLPGQGSQALGMGQELHRDEPVFGAALEECAALFAALTGEDLLAVIFAAPDEAAAERLRETRYAQPAIFAVTWAYAQLWRHWGIEPKALVGHSVGELVAAALAGIMSLEDAFRLVVRRGELMQTLAPGRMLAVRAEAKELEPRLSSEVGIAAVNGPRSVVVGGPTSEVEALREALERDGIACRPVPTSHAFHTKMVEPLVDAMRQLVSEVRLSPPTVPIVSTVTGRKLTDEEALSPDYWARHLRAPVLFADAVRSLAAAEDLALLEIGPRDTLAALARQSLPPAKRALVWASSNGRQAEDSAWRALLEAAGGLWAAGLALDWRAMPGPARRRKVELPSYPFAKTPCWLERRAPAEAATRPPVARQPETGFEPDAVGDGVGVSPSAGTVAALVAQQLEIMARQLRLLKGSSS